MNFKSIGILDKGEVINNSYRVLLFIKKSDNAETYRVKGEDGKIYFLKLFNYSQLDLTAFDENSNILEIELVKSISNKNIIQYKESGQIIVSNNKYGYLITEFISGETLAERIIREPITSVYDIVQIASGILDALTYLHNLDNPIIHNEITPQNILLDLSNDTLGVKLIDFGQARYFHKSSKNYKRGNVNINFLASECFKNIYSPVTDLYSVGAVIYYMLFGMPPWFKDLSNYISERSNVEESIIEERKNPLQIPVVNTKFIDFDDSVLSVIKKALNQNSSLRYQNASQFNDALINRNRLKIIETSNDDSIIADNYKESIDSQVVSRKDVQKGKGFSAIAGMKSLKDQLQYDVINVLEHPEEYKKHNIGLPNGMLLYGPPGCGKTFFAERFSEEAGYNFIKVVASDLASIYVHGSQEKIGQLFKQAREKAPTILYFDELDAMVPNREGANTQSQSGEVNEFLSQLDNIGESGVFVIGSTNKPDLIDKAVLRAGRLEKWYYIPPPDIAAREALFELYLKDRPIDFGIDYKKLSQLTENYVSSDIKLLIDEASRKTIRESLKRITMSTLEYIISTQKPTVPLSELKKYESLRKKIEDGIDNDYGKPRIGFKP
jgi:transitional endoplasmic reticulum ATPase